MRPGGALQALGATALTVDVANPASVSGLAWQLDGEKIDVALYVAGVMAPAGAMHAAHARRFDARDAHQRAGRHAGHPAGGAAGGGGGRRVCLHQQLAWAASAAWRVQHAWLYRTSKAALNMAVASAQHDYPILVALSPAQTDAGDRSGELVHPGWVQDRRWAGVLVICLTWCCSQGSRRAVCRSLRRFALPTAWRSRMRATRCARLTAQRQGPLLAAPRRPRLPTPLVTGRA
jgi:hypothetical protein